VAEVVPRIGARRLLTLKMILAGAYAGAEHRTRLLAEAIARLHHPHIVQIYEAGEHAGLPFLALEYLLGGNLAARTGGQPQPPKPAASLAETLARAIAHAHAAGVIHRDLKPANVLLADDGRCGGRCGENPRCVSGRAVSCREAGSRTEAPARPRG
jgi:serine/threonine protein kinase